MRPTMPSWPAMSKKSYCFEINTEIGNSRPRAKHTHTYIKFNLSFYETPCFDLNYKCLYFIQKIKARRVLSWGVANWHN